MSIKTQIEDAHFLISNGKYDSALTLILLAIAASSKKVYPQGSQSIWNPANKMGDKEAFIQFLGGRINKIQNKGIGGDRAGLSGYNLNYQGVSKSFEEILYVYYRSYLIHEGQLPSNVEFVKDEFNPEGSNDNIGGVFVLRGDKYAGAFTRKSNGNFVLTYQWLTILTEVVYYADCNNALFGRYILDIFPVSGVNEVGINTMLVNELMPIIQAEGRHFQPEHTLINLKKLLLELKLDINSDLSRENIKKTFELLTSVPNSSARAYAGWLSFDRVTKRDYDYYFVDGRPIQIESPFELTEVGYTLIEKVAKCYEIK